MDFRLFYYYNFFLLKLFFSPSMSKSHKKPGGCTSGLKIKIYTLYYNNVWLPSTCSVEYSRACYTEWHTNMKPPRFLSFHNKFILTLIFVIWSEEYVSRYCEHFRIIILDIGTKVSCNHTNQYLPFFYKIFITYYFFDVKCELLNWWLFEKLNASKTNFEQE